MLLTQVLFTYSHQVQEFYFAFENRFKFPIVITNHLRCGEKYHLGNEYCIFSYFQWRQKVIRV